MPTVQTLLFYVSAGLSVASFALFAVLALRETKIKEMRQGAEVELGVTDAVKIADIAEKFQKAGPQATAATLSVFFLLVAAASSGIVSVAVDGAG